MLRPFLAFGLLLLACGPATIPTPTPTTPPELLTVILPPRSALPPAFHPAFDRLHTPQQALDQCNNTFHEVETSLLLALNQAELAGSPTVAKALRDRLKDLLYSTPPTLVFARDLYYFAPPILRLCIRAALDAGDHRAAYEWLHMLLEMQAAEPTDLADWHRLKP